MNEGNARLAVVTGAASGMGLATAQALIERATAVIGIDLADAPPELSGVPWIKGDVAAQETWDRAQSAAVDHDRRGADCLVACAADLVVAPFLATTIDEWRTLLDINVLGVVRGMQTLMPAMVEQGHGAIAVVCSVNSLFVEDELSAYSASKAALLSVVRSAALEYARKGLRINAVCPGVVDTPLLRRHFESLDDPDGARRAAERRTPTGRILRPGEIAEAICFLVSGRATGLSGATVTVDGGLTTAYDFDSGG
jgi:NAD(P)-dependent dehydrogenase (short-subunit alcohol dehydrogenase family)